MVRHFNLRISLVITLLALLATGCSDQKELDTAVHPADWLSSHGADKDSAGAADDCKKCHGDNYTGGTVGVGCYDCHVEGPPFILHPSVWTSALDDHSTFPLTMSWTTCTVAACHGADLDGGAFRQTATGPGCFSFSYSALSCHALGPPAPKAHFLNDDPSSGVLTYLDPDRHGAAAEGRITANILDPETSHFYCANCHSTTSTDFAGGMVALIPTAENPSCFTAATVCHDTHADALAHPSLWTVTDNPSRKHGSTPSVAWTVGCALCHEGTGVEATNRLAAAPSCISSDFINTTGAFISCHGPEGAQDVPHILGDNNEYLDGDLHGPDAKADLTLCQECHAQEGGAGTNPRFDVGILAVGDNGCEPCHGIGGAHPAMWAGPNVAGVFHYSAKKIQTACTLCHGASLDGVGGVGGSCLSCHTTTATFPLDCTACHGQPPTIATNEGVVIDQGGQLVDHGVVPLADHFGCLTCHGMTQGATAGTFDVDPNYTLFDPVTDRIGDHWDGFINMSGPSPDIGVGYNDFDFGCDNACHPNVPPFRMASSLLPISFGDYLVPGPLAPHLIGVPPSDPFSFSLGSNHGPAAKRNLTFCQQCHGQAGGAGTNPGFNLPMQNFALGCESCHLFARAHPTNWQGTTGAGTASHRPSLRQSTTCVLCHGPSLTGENGAIGPSCFSSSNVNSDGAVAACHSGGFMSLRPLHPTGWDTSHSVVVSLDSSTCVAECHLDLRNAPNAPIPGCANCHFGGAGSSLSLVHPDGSPLGPAWDNTIVNHQAFAINQSDPQCSAQFCHGNDLLGGTPPPNNSWGIGPGCNNTLGCH